MPRTPLIAPVLGLLLTCVAYSAGPDPLPTQKQITESYAAADYPKTLQMLSRVLALKGKAAEPYDRHALLLIKGETHLRMKATQPAIAAFAEASTAAPDGTAAAQDLATELLLRKVNVGLTYQPKSKSKDDKTKSLEPVSVLEPADRKKAIDLLYADERAAIEPKIAALKAQRAIPPVLEALPSLRNVRWLELASTGSDTNSKAMVADVLKNTQKLLESGLKEMADTTADIERSSMEVITRNIPVRDQQTGKVLRFDRKFAYQGPSNRQFQVLKENVAACKKIFDTSDELGGTLGETGKEFESAKATAKTVGTKANGLLEKNWKEIFDTPPTIAK